jgi:DNA polymerase-1
MAEPKEKKLVLIDSHALIHRAYHALPTLSTKKGERVNAVYGFVAVLLKVLKDLKPDYLVAAFDLPGPTFRHKEFEAYKATRIKAPDELYAQIGRVKEVVQAFDIPIFEKAGFEADDIIASLVTKSESQKIKIKNIIVTGDLDTLQLVSYRTNVFTLKKGIGDTLIYDEKAVRERFGLEPEQMPDFKGLKGDPSDNIPGVPGIGDKTAAQLLKQFGTIEEMYAKIEKLGKKSAKSKETDKNKKLYEKLIENKDQAIFSKYLATVKKDVPLKLDLEKAKFKQYDIKKVADIFRELEFFSLIDRLPKLADMKTEVMESVKAENPSEPGILEKIEQARQAGILSEKIYELEKNLVSVIEKMQSNGIKVNAQILDKLNEEFSVRLAELEKKIYQLTGGQFNISSPQQLSQVLFEKLKLAVKVLKKTTGRVISTAAPELAKLKGQHAVIDLVIEYRELAKLKTTYADSLPDLIDKKDGRIHTQYDQLGAVTGRLSSKNPNLQNIPIKTDLGNEIRKAFVAEQGSLLLSADYSQLELRIVASLAEDKKMIGILKEGLDIHSATAAEVFEIPLEKVTAKMRNSAKALNFGVIYGMSIHGFAQAAGIDPGRAKIFINKYFEEFAGVARYIEKTKEQVAKSGYVETLFGRKRFLPEINSSAWNLRAAAERAAINFPVQGTAADLVKMAMVAIDPELSSQKLKLLLQVHDELIFELPLGEINIFAPQIKQKMEGVFDLAAPLKVEIETGQNWGQLTKWKS